ncbi:MAG: endonuclease/exonuclease/phosphatase family protein [Melioribacteraceae bacterium]
MKKISLFITCLLFSANILISQNLQLMTYNLRYDNPNDGVNQWNNRKEFILCQINYYEPDIFGTQEGKTHQIEWLNTNLDNYAFVGIGREEEKGNGVGEYSAIFYNKNLIEVLESNTFWLSESPTLPTKGWDAAQYRICTYALFQNIKTGLRFYVFNTHFDHKGDIAREKSAELILQKLKTINKKNYPSVLMGDFNLTPDSAPIQKIASEMNDSKQICKTKPFGPEETFSDFDVCKSPQKRIDFIFTSKNNIEVAKYATIVDVENVRYPSDHYPVLISVNIKK